MNLHIQKFDEHRKEASMIRHYTVTDPDGNRTEVVPDEMLPSPEVLGCDWRLYSKEEPSDMYCAKPGATQWRVPRAVFNLAMCGFGFAPGMALCRQCNKPFKPRKEDWQWLPGKASGELLDSTLRSKATGLCLACEGTVLPEPQKLPPNNVIVHGTVYRIGDTKPRGNREFLGFGGSRWDILFNDGRRVTTWNLWHCGNIERFARGSLPDNAIFLIDRDELSRRELRRYQWPHRSFGESKRPTPWRVKCHDHGWVFLSAGEAYMQQWERRPYHCPRCGKHAELDWERERWSRMTLRERAKALCEDHIVPRLPAIKPAHLVRAAFLRLTGRCLHCRTIIAGETDAEGTANVPCDCGAVICPYCGDGDHCWCPEPEEYPDVY